MVERLLRLGVTIALLTPIGWAEIGGLIAGIALVAYRYTIGPQARGEAA